MCGSADRDREDRPARSPRVASSGSSGMSRPGRRSRCRVAVSAFSCARTGDAAIFPGPRRQQGEEDTTRYPRVAGRLGTREICAAESWILDDNVRVPDDLRSRRKLVDPLCTHAANVSLSGPSWHDLGEKPSGRASHTSSWRRAGPCLWAGLDARPPPSRAKATRRSALTLLPTLHLRSTRPTPRSHLETLRSSAR